MWQQLLSNNVLITLALTLLHFLWQGLLIAGALKLALTVVAPAKALFRYSLICIALLACLLIPITTFFGLYNSVAQSTLLTNTISFKPLVNLGQSAGINFTEAWFAQSVNYLSIISVIWFLGISLMAVKLILELYKVNQLPKSHYQAPNELLLLRFKALAAQIGLSHTPKLIISLSAKVPMAIGWLKPVVLLPAHMITGLSQAQLEMILLHELAHIRRHDYLVNFLQTLVEILLFFHPAVAWISTQMRLEREHCTDDIAVTHSESALAYAHTLADSAQLCYRHVSKPSMAMAATGGDLSQRVNRLVKYHCNSQSMQRKWLAGSIISLSVVLTALLQAKAPTTLTFQSEKNISVNKGDINNLANSNDSLKSTILAKQLLVSNNSPTTEINKQQAATTTSKNLQLESAKTQTISPSQTNLLASKPTNTHSALASKAKAPHQPQLAKTQNTQAKNTNSKPQLLISQNKPKLAKQPTQLSIIEQPFANVQPVVLKSTAIAQLEPIAKPLTLASTEKEIVQAISSYEAELIKLAEPKYPAIAMRRGIETEIKVNFTVGIDGRIRDIEFEGSRKMKYFKGSISTAMRKWRFLPAHNDGKPVESKMSKIFAFNLSRNQL